jgi:hypothetical protein
VGDPLHIEDFLANKRTTFGPLFKVCNSITELALFKDRPPRPHLWPQRVQNQITLVEDTKQVHLW